MINIDALMDNYVRFVARKYDLTEEQDAFTQQFVREKVDEFLESHGGELTGLVDRLFEVRSGGEMTQEELLEWGRSVLPIYEDARLVLVEANTDWREMLTDEQRLIHDRDVKLMHQSFRTTEDQLQRIVRGEMTVEEFRNPRFRPTRPREGERPAGLVRDDAAGATLDQTDTSSHDAVRERIRSQTARETRRGGAVRELERPRGRDRARRPVGDPVERGTPSKGKTSPAAGKGHESKWEAYVRQFIEKYQLDAEQQGRAHKILKSCQEEADRRMRRCQAQLEKLDKRAEELKKSKDGEKSKDRAKELAEITEKRNKLLAPIDDIFEKKLKPRLERLPTRAQRQAAKKRTGLPDLRRASGTSKSKPPKPQP